MTELAFFYTAAKIAVNHVTHHLAWFMKITLLLSCRHIWQLFVAGGGGSALAAPCPSDGCHRSDTVLNSKLGTSALPEYTQPCSLQRKMPVLALKIKM